MVWIPHTHSEYSKCEQDIDLYNTTKLSGVRWMKFLLIIPSIWDWYNYALLIFASICSPNLSLQSKTIPKSFILSTLSITVSDTVYSLGYSIHHCLLHCITYVHVFYCLISDGHGLRLVLPLCFALLFEGTVHRVNSRVRGHAKDNSSNLCCAILF